jgi:hypothetical protein
MEAQAQTATTEVTELDIEECMLERKQTVTVNLLVNNDGGNKISKIINAHRFGSLTKLYRVTEYILKIINFIKQIPLVEQLIAEVESFWLLDCQASLKNNPNYSIWKSQLGLFLDGYGLIRCCGRLGNEDIHYNTRYPILLESKHQLCKLIVLDCHQRVKHNGVKETLTELRSKFWIIMGDHSFVRLFDVASSVANLKALTTLCLLHHLCPHPGSIKLQHSQL